MNQIMYKGKHTFDPEMIDDVLKNMGCEDIVDNDYVMGGLPKWKYCPEKATTISSGETFIPDYLCKYNNEDTAVEIGDLSVKDKIEKLLECYKYVIHIFADKKLYLFHCLLYERKELNTKLFENKLKEHIDKCNEIMEQIS